MYKDRLNTNGLHKKTIKLSDYKLALSALGQTN